MLTIMVALHCEAKPLIDFYGLKKQVGANKNHAHPFSLYQDLDHKHTVELVVTGIGALAMAAAIGWVAAQPLNCGAQRVWLNVGTAGHATHELGRLFLVHGVGDEAQQRSHYPPLVAKWQGATEAVLSVSAPCRDYPGGAAVDMEGFAFYNAACRFSDAELVQSMKVVSDNEQTGIDALNAAKITDLISPHVETIHQFGQRLLSLKPDLPLSIDDFMVLPDLRATHSQRQQLNIALNKLSVLGKTQPELDSLASGCDDVRQVLVVLNDELAALAPKLKSPSGKVVKHG